MGLILSYQILISTMHKSTQEVLSLLDKLNINCDVLVVVQGDKEGFKKILTGKQIIEIVYSTERGLSKSRNLAIAHCTSKYAFIMDDDVLVSREALDRLVLNAEKEDLDVFTCSFLYENGNSSKPNLKSDFVHNFFTLAKVSSIEIGFKVESIRKNKIWFNEEFGLGTKLPSGEEYVFLTDCLKKKLKIKFFPIVVGVHPNVTSGMDFYTTTSKILAKREMLKYIFKWKSPFFLLIFWLKKTPYLIKVGYWAKFSKVFLLGIK